MTADIIVDSNGKRSFVTRGSVSGEITIPDGYEAVIKGNKITFQKKESEDEKTRKKIVAIFKTITNCDEKEREKILNWLEKHKEDYSKFSDEDKKKEDDLNKKYLEGYSKGCLDGYKLALESTSYHTPYVVPCYAPDGICTNPQMDCINCPKQCSARDFITNISMAEK